MKNSVPQALSCGVTGVSIGVTQSCNNTAASFSKAPGDNISIQLAQTNSTPADRTAISTRCQ